MATVRLQGLLNGELALGASLRKWAFSFRQWELQKVVELGEVYNVLCFWSIT